MIVYYLQNRIMYVQANCPMNMKFRLIIIVIRQKKIFRNHLLFVDDQYQIIMRLIFLNLNYLIMNNNFNRIHLMTMIAKMNNKQMISQQRY
jgi:hypothetical protein